jgi:glycogen operon protein
MMVHYYDASVGPELVVLFNMELGEKTFKLPEGRQWKVLVDTQAYFDSPAYIDGNGKDPRKTSNVTLESPAVANGSYRALSRTIVILRAE